MKRTKQNNKQTKQKIATYFTSCHNRTDSCRKRKSLYSVKMKYLQRMKI